MQFHSPEFVLFFIIVVLLHWTMAPSAKAQNIFLILASIVFYCTWDMRSVCIPLIITVITFYAARLMHDFKDEHYRLIFFWFAMAVNFGCLFAFKYVDFFLQSFVRLFPVNNSSLSFRTLVPVGLSFFTLNAVGYLLDVKTGIPPCRDITQFCPFVFFFPHLLSGPIARTKSLLPQFARKRDLHYGEMMYGLTRISVGLFKKVVVADTLSKYVDNVFENSHYQTFLNLTIATFVFSLQLYADFSGYTDMAIGSAKMFGIRLDENFATPYSSRTVAEFWRRWHISLSNWLRDYVYIPLKGNKVPHLRWCCNILIVFLISGLWHGANWTYILWGTMHAIFIIVQKWTFPQKKEHTIIENCAQVCITYLVVCLAWFFFRLPSLEQIPMMVRQCLEHTTTNLPCLLAGNSVSYILSALFAGACLLTMDLLWPKVGTSPLKNVLITISTIVLIVFRGILSGSTFIYTQY